MKESLLMAIDDRNYQALQSHLNKFLKQNLKPNSMIIQTIEDEYETLLDVAFKNEDIISVMYLLYAGFSLGETIYFHDLMRKSIQANAIDEVKCLSALKIDIKEYFIDAVAYDKVEMVKFLIDAKADVHAKTPEEGETALHYAKSFEMIGLLLKNGAKLEEKNKRGLTPFFTRIMENSGHNTAIIRRFLVYGADLNSEEQLEYSQELSRRLSSEEDLDNSIFTEQLVDLLRAGCFIPFNRNFSGLLLKVYKEELSIYFSCLLYEIFERFTGKLVNIISEYVLVEETKSENTKMEVVDKPPSAILNFPKLYFLPPLLNNLKRISLEILPSDPGRYLCDRFMALTEAILQSRIGSMELILRIFLDHLQDDLFKKRYYSANDPVLKVLSEFFQHIPFHTGLQRDAENLMKDLTEGPFITRPVLLKKEIPLLLEGGKIDKASKDQLVVGQLLFYEPLYKKVIAEILQQYIPGDLTQLTYDYWFEVKSFVSIYSEMDQKTCIPSLNILKQDLLTPFLEKLTELNKKPHDFINHTIHFIQSTIENYLWVPKLIRLTFILHFIDLSQKILWIKANSELHKTISNLLGLFFNETEKYLILGNCTHKPLSRTPPPCTDNKSSFFPNNKNGQENSNSPDIQKARVRSTSFP